jgi:hypothetical protein
MDFPRAACRADHQHFPRPVAEVQHGVWNTSFNYAKERSRHHQGPPQTGEVAAKGGSCSIGGSS